MNEAVRNLVGRTEGTSRSATGTVAEPQRCYGYLSKFIAVEVKWNIRQIAAEAPLGQDEGLPQPCVANCDNIRVVPKVSLTKRAGQLAPERWVEVKRAVGAAFGWRELTDLD